MKTNSTARPSSPDGAGASRYASQEPFSHVDLPASPQVSEAGERRLKVALVLWPEFTLLAFAGFLDALRLAADIGDRSEQIHCQWEVMTHDGGPVRASCGLQVTPSSGLINPERFDFVVAVTGRIRGIEKAPAALERYLVEAAQRGVRLVGLCTGGIALGRAGLLSGRRCCIANYHLEDLQDMCPDAIPVHGQLFVDEGPVITCSGGVASIDLATHLIERHLGAQRRDKLTYHLQMDFIRKGEHAQNVFEADLAHLQDKKVKKAVMLMKQSFNGTLSIADIAGRVNLSERQLERLFDKTFARPPSSVYRQLRVERGVWLLENTNRSITQIAFDTGFADGAHFARHFKAMMGFSPSALRGARQKAARA